jgi:hypothetical protein
MKIEHKKLIAKEILWFGVFFFVALLIAGIPVKVFWWRGLILYEWNINWDFKTVVVVLAFLYLLRAIRWAIKILFFSKRTQTGSMKKG